MSGVTVMIGMVSVIAVTVMTGMASVTVLTVMTVMPVVSGMTVMTVMVGVIVMTFMPFMAGGTDITVRAGGTVITEILKAGDTRPRKIFLSPRNILVVERKIARTIHFLPGFYYFCFKKKYLYCDIFSNLLALFFLTVFLSLQK